MNDNLGVSIRYVLDCKRVRMNGQIEQSSSRVAIRHVSALATQDPKRYNPEHPFLVYGSHQPRYAVWRCVGVQFLS